MITNGQALKSMNVFNPEQYHKDNYNGVSYGYSEAGYDVRIKQDVTLHGFKRFSLASTVERFTMPADHVAVLHDKSSLIRRKLIVGNTVMEPGWEGYLTLELFYFGWKPIHLKGGQGIGQVLFHRVTEQAFYGGKYQNQPNRPVESIYGK